MIEIIGAPFDLGGAMMGSRLGPEALRLAGLRPELEALGLAVEDGGDVPVRAEARAGEGIRGMASALDCVRQLQTWCAASLKAGKVPLVLGGEHTIAAGGISAALQVYGGDLAVLWVDAHADVNTPKTSPSGHVHGMPLAALAGLASGVKGKAEADWKSFLDVLGPNRLRPDRVAWLGLRDVDPGERDLLASWPKCFVSTMHDVDRHGAVFEIERFHEWMSGTGCSRLWISFDVDALDPFLAPGSGTTVRGGLTYREAHLCAEMLREQLDAAGAGYRLAGVDLVETNPLWDERNRTARVTVEWIASLFGKTILGKR